MVLSPRRWWKVLADSSWISSALQRNGTRMIRGCQFFWRHAFPGVLISGRDLCGEQLSEADVHTLEYLAGAITPVLQGARVLRGV